MGITIGYAPKKKANFPAPSLKTSLAAIFLILGFSSIVLYVGSTMFFPLFQFDEFLGLALQDSVEEVLVVRYVGYLPLMIFGIISVIAGNWIWYTKKEIENTLLIIISMPLLTTFVIVLLKSIPF